MYYFFKIQHVIDVIWCLSFSVWLYLVWQSLGESMSVKVALFCSFYDRVYIYHIFIHSSVNGHLSCFCVLAIVYGAAMNTRVQVPFWIMVFFHMYAQQLGLMVHLFLAFWGASILFSIVAIQIYISTNSVGEKPQCSNCQISLIIEYMRWRNPYHFFYKVSKLMSLIFYLRSHRITLSSSQW